MLTALAAGALVLSTVALIVAVRSVRARTAPPLGATQVGSAQSDAPHDAFAPGDAARGDRARNDAAGRDRRRLEFVEAAARCATADELGATVVHAVSVIAPRADAEVRLDGLGPDAPGLNAPGLNAPGAGIPRVPGSAVTGRCPVPDTGSCPAVRHATVVTCADSRGVDACPWLAGRPVVTAAVCAPVAVDGRGVGYVHVAQPLVPDRAEGHPHGTDSVPSGAVDRPLVDEVTWLAAHLGTRLGPPVPLPSPVEPVPSPSPVEPVPSPSLVEPVPSPSLVEPVPPVILDLTVPVAPAPVTPVPTAEVATPIEPVHAAADGVANGATGWSTPPEFLVALGSERSSGGAFVLVLAAVDDLAALVDRDGHPAAEVAVAALGRALVADPDPLGPAAVLACSRLDEATVGVAWSDLTLGRSVELIEVVRSELLDRESDGAVPACRRSFGLTHSSVSEDPHLLLAAARAGLDRARSFGGDQIVYADLSLLE